jgi:uncharacterized protein YjiS (DUF1127 family)
MRSIRFYKTVHELSLLNDKELADIGLNRFEIPVIALKVNLLPK